MFEYGYRDNNEIYVMNADGKNRKRLTRNKVYDGEAQWSPDGKRIAFGSYRDGNREIYVMNADGSKKKHLTKNTAFDRDPQWSPDGKRIAFASWGIYVMNADGSKQKRLTKNRSVDAPVWSPDGKRIAFMSWREGYPEIYAMNSNGSNQKRLTKNKTYKYAPVWQPTPQKAPRLSTFARRVVEITNQKRVKNGCPKLTLNSRLTAAAQRHSDDMAAHDFIEHTGSDGSNPGDRISDAGYEDNWWAENIVGASRTPKEAVDAWMGSKPHRKNILNCELTEIGVGYSKNTDTSAKHFWVQVLAQPKNSTQSIVPDGSDTVELEAEPEAQEPLFLPHVLR